MSAPALDPQARFPEPELIALAIEYEKAAELWTFHSRSALAKSARAKANTIRQAIDAHDALRDRCLTAEVRVLPRVSPPALAGEEPT